MSQLVEKLNQLIKGAPQALGFRAAQTATAKPKMLLIASNAGASRLAEDKVGADAILIEKPNPDTKTVQQVARGLADVPWGWRLKDNTSKDTMTVVVEGGDFIVFPANASPVIPEAKKTGKILEVESSLGEGLVRAINELPVDAVLAANEPGEEPQLTWYHLMRYTRIAGLLSKPLLVYVPLKVTDSELEALWRAGVVGVVAAEGGIKELRQIIDKMIFPPRQREEIGALIPHLREETTGTTEEEEEAEEEEE